MYSNHREGLITKCGLDCSICELYLCAENPELYDDLILQGISEDILPCNGCNANKGKCPVEVKECDIYKCAEEREFRYCFECEDFPCERFQPIADGSDKNLHNLKIYNSCLIKSQGIDFLLEKSKSIKEKYCREKHVVACGVK